VRQAALRAVLGTLVLVLGAAPLGCSRKGDRHAEQPEANPAAVPHPCPPQPTGPQTAGRDSLLNRFRRPLDEWAALWAPAQPGFGLDSTWRVRKSLWSPSQTREFDMLSQDDVTFGILGIRSPDGRLVLDVDAYQVIVPGPDTVDVGGEPDSRCSLIDTRTRRETVLGQCGTPCGFHWGAWLTSRTFAVGSWTDADDFGQWKQAQLSIYSIPDSTVTEYQTRIVSAADYARYVRAWHAWLLERYRTLVKSKPRV